MDAPFESSQTWTDSIMENFHSGLYEFENLFENQFNIFWTRVPITSAEQSFWMAFSQGLFKIQPRLTSNCLNQGKVIVEGWLKLTKKFILSSHIRGQEEFNFEDSSTFVGQKCQLMDTLPATVIANFLINRIDELPSTVRDYFRWLRFILRALDAMGFIETFVEMGYLLQLSMERTSLQHSGKFLGKVIKLLTQLYMMDTFGSLLRF